MAEEAEGVVLQAFSAQDMHKQCQGVPSPRSAHAVRGKKTRGPAVAGTASPGAAQPSLRGSPESGSARECLLPMRARRVQARSSGGAVRSAADNLYGPMEASWRCLSTCVWGSSPGDWETPGRPLWCDAFSFGRNALFCLG